MLLRIAIGLLLWDSVASVKAQAASAEAESFPNQAAGLAQTHCRVPAHCSIVASWQGVLLYSNGIELVDVRRV